MRGSLFATLLLLASSSVGDDKNILTMEMGESPQINRLTINSTYDDSVIVSAIAYYMNYVLNLTVIRGANAEEISAFEKLKRSLKSWLLSITLPVEKAISAARKYLARVTEMTNRTKDDFDSLKRLLALPSTLAAPHGKLKERFGEKELNRTLNWFERLVENTDWSDGQIESLDEVANLLELRVKASKKASHIIRTMKLLNDYAGRKTRAHELRRIAAAIDGNFFTAENASLLIGYIDKLNQLKAKPLDGIVKSLKREILYLSEVIIAIDGAKEVLQLPMSSDLRPVAEALAKELQRTLPGLRNKPLQDEANRKLEELNEMLMQSEDDKELMTSLDGVNQTLQSGNDYGGKTGLKLIERKLQNVIDDSETEKQVRERAAALLSMVESHQRKIDDVLEMLDKIEKDEKVGDLPATIEKVEKAKLTVHDPVVDAKAVKLLEKLQHDKPKANQEKSKPRQMTEKQPQTKVPSKESDANELHRIIGGFLQQTLPQLNKIASSIDNQKNNESLKRQIVTVREKLRVAELDFHSIVKDLRSLKLTSESTSTAAPVKYESTSKTLQALSNLHGLLDDADASALLKKTSSIVQSVGHANDMLKQLVAFNMKLLSPESEATAVTEKPIKHVIVPTERVNLHPPTRGEPGKKN